MYINQTRDFCYSGFDARTMLEVLSGVRYYVVPSRNSGLRPYGYNVCINRGTLGAGGQYEVNAMLMKMIRYCRLDLQVMR